MDWASSGMWGFKSSYFTVNNIENVMRPILISPANWRLYSISEEASDTRKLISTLTAIIGNILATSTKVWLKTSSWRFLDDISNRSKTIKPKCQNEFLHEHLCFPPPPTPLLHHHRQAIATVSAPCKATISALHHRHHSVLKIYFFRFGCFDGIMWCLYCSFSFRSIFSSLQTV